MKIKIITVGSPQLSFAKDGIAEYMKRLTRFADVQLIHIKENKDTQKKILATVGQDYCIALDENGREYTTQGLAQFLEKQKNQSRSISFLIGGPHGHEDIIRERANHMMALSQLTFPHDIAMMLVLETIYRSLTVLVGHPYHRE